MPVHLKISQNANWASCSSIYYPALQNITAIFRNKQKHSIVVNNFSVRSPKTLDQAIGAMQMCSDFVFIELITHQQYFILLH